MPSLGTDDDDAPGVAALAAFSDMKGPPMPAAIPIDLLDELAAIIDLVDCAQAACGAFAATPVGTVLDVASGRLGALKADFAALGQTSEASHGK